MRRLPRLLVLVLFSCLMLLPSTAYAGDVYVAVRTGPEDTGTVSGGGTYADGSDVTLWWVGTYVTDWEFDHWEVSGSSVIQSYQNPYTTTVHDDGTGTVTYSAILKYSPHTHNRVYHAAVYPTCISDGTIEYYSCDTCGRMFSDYDMINEIYSSDLVWPGGSSWHNPVHVDFQYADCENDGRKEHWWCSICQQRFWDEALTMPISGTEWVLPAYGHNLSNVPGKLPTCTQAGSKEYYTCSKCGKWFWDSAAAYEIPAHSTEILLDPTGHNFGPWQVTKAATCAVDGQEERTCTDCGG